MLAAAKERGSGVGDARTPRAEKSKGGARPSLHLFMRERFFFFGRGGDSEMSPAGSVAPGGRWLCPI